MYLCVFIPSQIPTHHDSSNANAHITDDVEFTVEEIFDACITVLQSKDKRSQAKLSSSEPGCFVRHHDSLTLQQKGILIAILSLGVMTNPTLVSG